MSQKIDDTVDHPVRSGLPPWLLISGVIGLFLGGLLTVGLIIAVTQGNQPIVIKRGLAEQQLPDGTWLIIEDVTWGSAHTFTPPAEPRSLWDFSPGPRSHSTMHAHTGNPGMVVWMSLLAEDKKQPLDPLFWGRSVIIDSRGREISDENPQRSAEYLHGSGSSSSSRPFPPIGTTLHHGGGPFKHIVANSQFPAIRTAAGKFHLSVRDMTQKEVAAFDLAYPGPAPVTGWKPVALPVTVPVGDLQLTLKSIRSSIDTRAKYENSSTSFGGYKSEAEVAANLKRAPGQFELYHHLHHNYDFEFQRDGQPVSDWQVDQYMLTDDLGNQEGYQMSLDPRDTAWKLSGQAARRSTAKFDPSETWTATPVPLPEDGKSTELLQSTKLQGHDISWISLGHGVVKHTWANTTGVHHSSYSSSGNAGETSYQLNMIRDPSHNTVEINCPLPHLMFKLNFTYGAKRLIIRVRNAAGEEIKSFGHQQLEDYTFVFFEPQPAGTEVYPEVIIYEARPFEIIIAPPPVPEQLSDVYPPITP